MSDVNNVKTKIIDSLEKAKVHLKSENHVLTNLESLNLEGLINKVNEVFIVEEIEINELSNEGVSTYIEESLLKEFAKDVTNILFFEDVESLNSDDLNKLAKNKYIGYGYFSNLNKGTYNKESIDSSIYHQLYISLALHFKEFYGRFSDNEEALTLLFKFYPNNDVNYNLNEKALIVAAFYNHITNAGSPTDFGYAYNGIEIIKKYSKQVSIDIIIKILDSYQISKIVNTNIHRHQIYTLIVSSKISTSKRAEYKFWYLDSLVIANILNPILYEIHNDEISAPSFLTYEKNLEDDEIELFSLNNGNISYWINNKQSMTERKFIMDNKNVLSINLSDSNTIIISGNKDLKVEWKFEIDNWLLDEIESKKKYHKLKAFLENTFNSDSIPNSSLDEKKFSFSLMYISNYRGIESQFINFDHKYHFDLKEKIVFEGAQNKIPHFYSSNIYSLTCIVGKNGTGKSSVVNFLKDYFFSLMKSIIDNVVLCSSGYLVKTKKIEQMIDENCEFFIIFNLNDKPYFISNMNPNRINLNNVKLEGLSNGIILNESELSKVMYFSNMFSFQSELLQPSDKKKKSNENNNSWLQKSLFNSRQVDYSETSSASYKFSQLTSSNYSKIINKDLVYQLVFLYFINQKKFSNEDLQLDFLEDLSIYSPSLGKTQKITYDNNWDITQFMSNHSIFLQGVDSKILHFSSGQYAKFSFFSKLYWSLEGYHINFDAIKTIMIKKLDFEENKVKSDFNQDYVISENEFSLIFIDEGELYYHPEWQRLYIYELIKFIEYFNTKFNLQIIITSNSPFILSDILAEDIVYLPVESSPNERTLAENIHRLLTHDFYMSYTIGENSKKFIEQIIEVINSRNEEKIEAFLVKYYNHVNKNEWYEKLFVLIDKIAEPIYRNTLIDMLNKLEVEKDPILIKLESELSAIQKKEIDLIKQIQLIKKSDDLDIHR